MTNPLGYRLSRPPLVYVLCQIRFSPVVSVSDFVPAIQGKLRREYPRFSPEVLNLIKFSESGGAIETAVGHRWLFENKARDAGFVLTQDSLVYHTTAYVDFSHFTEALEGGLSIAKEILDIALFDRIGLRYIDYIVPSGDRPLSSYVNPGLCGFEVAEEEVKTVGQKHEARMVTAIGELVLKYIQGNHRSMLPDDLTPLSLQLGREAATDRQTAILDIDHYRAVSDDFAVSEILRVLECLHDGTSQFFEAAVSEEAIEEWK